MSQSPTSAIDLTDYDSYFQGWDRLEKLLRSGRSFSGRERNCCFLNTGNGKFADVSSVSGLDLIDDGRAIATVDWDQDGDLDLWLANRTAPRLRFLKNNGPQDNQFLAIRLEGTTCNRDAIGARVEVKLQKQSDRASSQVLVKTLRAGEGYLGQSSKWLHFGLGKEAKIQKLSVHWPDGQAEEFTDVEPDRRYKIVQGQGKAELWQPPQRTVELTSSTPQVPPSSQQVAILLTERVPLPSLMYDSFSGDSTFNALDPTRHSPLLINLWASWCKPCLAELAEFTSQEEQLRSAGLDIVALSVDRLDDRNSNTEAAKKILKRLGFPFRSGVASDALVEKLQIIIEYLYYDIRSMPVPTSFLVDSEHKLAAIYRGQVSLERLLADVGRLDMQGESLRVAAHGASGQWYKLPPPNALVPLVEALRLAGHIDDVVKYVTQNGEALAREQNFPVLLNRLGTSLGQKGDHVQAHNYFQEAVERKPDFTFAHYNLGWTLVQLDRRSEAIDALKNAIGSDENYIQSHELLIKLLLQEKRFDEAIVHLKRIRDEQIALPEARFKLATLLHAKHRPAEAAEEYKAVLKQYPDHLGAHNNYSWLLATSNDDEIRDGQQALQHAQQATELAGREDPNIISTLAAAYAELGQYKQAIEAAERASRLAGEAGRDQLVEQLNRQLQKYRSGQPNREP